MTRPIPRRQFLQTTALAAGSLARVPSAQGTGRATQEVRIGSARYVPADYPIQALRPWDVRLNDTFWKPRLATNVRTTIPLLAARNEGRGLNGNVLEAAIVALRAHPDAKLQALVDSRVAALPSQPARGNSGFEVAVSYFNATGKRDLLDRAIATADALYAEFEAKNPPFSGGERDAVNCLQLYRATQNRKYLDLAKHYLDIRGLPNSVNRSRHNQSYKPVLEQSEAVGHAVNGVTLMMSMLDVGILTGLSSYVTAARRMWTDIVSRKMYVTGGVGSTGNEGFGEPYSLPNISAYAETCAVLMFATFNHKLFLATGDGQYIDVLERGIYNNALSGVSLSGDRFFYVNRLASAGDGRDTRWERASLECCPPNLVRFLASMPTYIYAQDRAGAVYVNLYVSSDAKFPVVNRELPLSVTSEMPWGGRTSIVAQPESSVRAVLKLRVPGWARNRVAPGALYSYGIPLDGTVTMKVNGARMNVIVDRMGYISLDREWRPGDRIDLDFPFTNRQVVADKRVRETRGRVAIERGPLVYCLEAPDVDDRKALDVRLSDDRPPTVQQGTVPGFENVIKASAMSLSKPDAARREITLVPYYAWANRGAGEMTVWLPTREYVPGDTGPAGGLIFYVNPSAATDGWRYLEAAPFDQSIGAKWGCFRTAIQGARGMAIGTGRQNTRDMLAACTDKGTAADLCASFVLNGVGGWFLPSRDELSMMYKNLKATGAGDFLDAGMNDNCQYWTSSQETADMANHIDFADNGRLHYDDKDFPRRVRAIRVL